ncbi:MAG: ArsR/SmtB family transcription factor [Candidatus Natronoplasma sp.]
MEKDEFEEIIQVLQNRTRRRILQLLSREENYPLEMSRCLDTSQQAISKHLKKLEEKGLVVSKKSESEKGGPPTKTYTLNKEFSVRIDVGPQLFDTEVEDLRDEDIEGYQEIEKKLEEGIIEESFLEGHRKIIQSIKKDIRRSEKERKYLLKLKEKALSQAYRHIHENIDDYDKREILYHVLESGETDPRKIAKYFNVREDEIERLIWDLKKKDGVNIW